MRFPTEYQCDCLTTFALSLPMHNSTIRSWYDCKCSGVQFSGGYPVLEDRVKETEENFSLILIQCLRWNIFKLIFLLWDENFRIKEIVDCSIQCDERNNFAHLFYLFISKGSYMNNINNLTILS